jgi:hypothetical protein
MNRMIEEFLDFFTQIGSHHFLAMGIVLIVLWLLISGIREGLKKESRDEGSEEDDEDPHGD